MSQLLGTVGIYTLGCKVNQYESEAIAEGLASRGFSVVPFSEVCDAYIINTCTVTAESDRKARQLIRRAIKNNPTAYILVTGCMAEVFSDFFKLEKKKAPVTEPAPDDNPVSLSAELEAMSARLAEIAEILSK